MSRQIRGPVVYTDYTTVKTGDHTVTNAAGVIVNKPIGAATKITLPANPDLYRDVVVKDGKGDAATNPITVVGSAGATIDGQISAVINVAFGALRFIWNSIQWNILGIAHQTTTTTTTTTSTTTTSGS